MSDIEISIARLKKEKNALILAHYYQPLDVQDISDHVGDSFALARLARDAAEDVIVLCGVRFMAESAKILSPGKTVYLPAPDAGCPMADMISPEDVLSLRSKYPKAAVVCYVNSSAAVKAVCDICCTSSSAVRIVRSLTSREIIFVPDKNLGAYVAGQVPEKKVITFNGCCPTHDRVSGEDAGAARRAHPDAMFLMHPECRPEVLEYADYIGSTEGILETARASGAMKLVIGTETGVIELLQREFPDKKIFALKTGFVCPNMKKTRPLDVLSCLEGSRAPVELSREELDGAKLSLERMVKA